MGGESNFTAQTASISRSVGQTYVEPNSGVPLAVDPIVVKISKVQLEKSTVDTTILMKQVVEGPDFPQTTRYRDGIMRLQKKSEGK